MNNDFNACEENRIWPVTNGSEMMLKRPTITVNA
jgi:hypothetical protein